MGVYILPDGRPYVAVSSPFAGHLLYAEADGLSAEPCYRVDERGQVLDVILLLPVYPKGALQDTERAYVERKKKKHRSSSGSVS
jgi:hypothetical protein